MLSIFKKKEVDYKTLFLVMHWISVEAAMNNIDISKPLIIFRRSELIKLIDDTAVEFKGPFINDNEQVDQIFTHLLISKLLKGR